MSGKGDLELACSEIPEFDGSIRWACDKELVGWIDSDGSDPTPVALDDGFEFPGPMPIRLDNFRDSVG